MFGKKKKAVSYEEKIQEAKYKRIYQALKDIAGMEVKAGKGKDGKDEIDYAATCSEIKTKAQLAIDFVRDIENDDDDKKSRR